MKSSRRRLLPLLFSSSLVCAGLLGAGCSSSLNYNRALFERIRNRGIVPLSSDNPYLAANLLIAKEMERSSELKGFIEHRGAPLAINVESGFLSPTVMDLFYPEQKEFYTLEAQGDSWIISGPIKLSADRVRDLNVLTRNVNGEPSLSNSVNTSEKPSAKSTPKFSNDKNLGTEDFGDDPVIEKLTKTSREPFSSPAKKSLPRPPSPPSEPRSKTMVEVVPPPSLSDAKPSLEEIIERYGKHPGEISSKGDLVHYVTYNGETLMMLARWYTLDESNAARIARMNGVTSPNSLSPGDTIIIPNYLLKNKFRLTEEAVTALRN